MFFLAENVNKTHASGLTRISCRGNLSSHLHMICKGGKKALSCNFEKKFEKNYGIHPHFIYWILFKSGFLLTRCQTPLTSPIKTNQLFHA